MDNINLKRACSELSDVLLSSAPRSEKEILEKMVTTSSHLALTQTNAPRATVVSNKVMGGGRTYPLEIKIGGMVIGLSLITNYEDMPNGMNRFLEIVPVYVLRGSRVHWWAFETDLLVISLLTNQIQSLTATLTK